MGERRAFAVLVNGGDEPPFGSQAAFLLPLIETAHGRGLAVGLFDLASLEDRDAASGTWFAVGDLAGVAGVFALPPVVYDRHLDGTDGDHTRRLRLAEHRVVMNPPAVQALMVDKLWTNRLLRDAGIPVPLERRHGGRRGKTVTKPRFGRLGRGVEIQRRRPWGRVAPSRDEAMVSQEYIEPMPFGGAHPHVKVHVQRDGVDLRAVGAAVRYWPEPFIGTGDLPAAAPVGDYEAVLPSDAVPRGGLVHTTGNVAVQAVQALEGHAGVVHEAAVDVVIGRHGGLTVIEVNSKPGRGNYRLLADDPDVAEDLRRAAHEGEAAARRRLVDDVVRHLESWTLAPRADG